MTSVGSGDLHLGYPQLQEQKSVTEQSSKALQDKEEELRKALKNVEVLTSVASLACIKIGNYIYMKHTGSSLACVT